MKDTLHIKWPWEMIWIEYADEISAQIKDALPPDHELQRHKIFPAIKWERRQIYIVDDDSTGHYLVMDFETMKRWKKTKFRVPTIKMLKDRKEVADMIECDHMAECAKYNDDGTLKK